MIISLLTIALFSCWIFIIANASYYFVRLVDYKWTLHKHPEDNICCCGAHADDHSYSDNHSVKTMREWYIESNRPKFR